MKMNKILTIFMVAVTTFFVLSVAAIQAQTLVGQWGSIGGRTGGGRWIIVTGNPGNASTVGDTVPAGQWATIRGGFDAPVTATEDSAIIVSGHIEFVGSGPVTWSGLRYGMFRHDSVGTLLYAGTDSAQWSGKEGNAYGYMFTPQSGTTYTGNIPSGFNASQGVCVNGNWISTFSGFGFGGLLPQAPARAIFDEGTYDWAISVQPLGDGTNEVRFYMVKQHDPGTQTTYRYWGALIDTSGVSTTFNGICFGLNPNYDETTSPIRELNLTDVQVDLGDPLSLGINPKEGLLPETYSLRQNYPNPFNPATTIEFALPQSGNVSLVVYDVTGRTVAELASGHFAAGYHKITFDARNLASGIYFYRLRVKDFVGVKKLVLMR